MLNLETITLSRGGRNVVNDINLKADKGDLIALLGPNGAGKTTFLHFLSGLLKGDSGTVYFEGIKIDPSVSGWRRRVSYVLDDGGTIPLLTVEEQLSLHCLLTGAGRGESIDRTGHVIELLGLNKYRSYRSDELSAGLRKRLGIGLGIVREADVFLFDEPFNGLDIEGTAVLGRIFKVLKRKGRIVMVASHLFPLLNDLYNRVWSFSAGSVLEHSDKQAIIDHLDNPVITGNLNAEESDIPWIRPPG